MIPLEQIHVASPCHADWDGMSGTDQARFCRSCRKNVYDLSEMTRAEAEALIREKEGRLCVRFYTRADGTVLTQDCPAGLRAVRYRRAGKMSYAAVLLLSCGTGLLRGGGAVRAVTPVKRAASSIQRPVRPDTARPTPRRTLGKIALPHSKPPHPAAGPDPFALPSAPLTRTMGMIAAPLPPPVIDKRSRG